MASLVPQMVRICPQCGRHGFDPRVGKIPWKREWQPTPVFLLGEFQGQRSLAGYSPRDHKELDTTEWLTLSLKIFLAFWSPNSNDRLHVGLQALAETRDQTCLTPGSYKEREPSSRWWWGIHTSQYFRGDVGSHLAWHHSLKWYHLSTQFWLLF